VDLSLSLPPHQESSSHGPRRASQCWTTEAREKAATQRHLILSGLDPIEVRKEEKRKRAAEAVKTVTFSQCASAYIQSHRPGWRNEKHGDQWENTIRIYCEPLIGSLGVQDVDNECVLKILEPIWATKPETASRLRGRIENILDWAKVRGFRSGENPAQWKGNLKYQLPALAKNDRVKHHSAMPFVEVGRLIAKLREIPSVAARCLEFTIFTAARTIEATQARPDEIDLANATWTVPGSRMKAKREHRVPLCPRALEIVREMVGHKRAYLFPGTKPGKPISNMTMLGLLERMGVDATVHGFRSAFRDWAAERTNFPHEVCEMALAHTISNSAEAAYRRGDLFEKRRKLMDAWATYLDSPQQENSVVTLRSAAGSQPR